jgi:hypothetical protein
VCLEQIKTHVLIPCMHLCLCGGCGELLRSQPKATCPTCSEVVRTRARHTHGQTRMLYTHIALHFTLIHDYSSIVTNCYAGAASLTDLPVIVHVLPSWLYAAMHSGRF